MVAGARTRVRFGLTGLRPGESVTVRLEAKVGRAVIAGRRVRFRARRLPIRTLAATSITATSAVIHGVVDPNRARGVSGAFRWSPVGGGPRRTTTGTPLPADARWHAFGLSLRGLAPGTQYQFDAVAIARRGLVLPCGCTLRFTTAPSPPGGTPPGGTPSGGTPHIMEIVMENHGAGAIIGNGSAPFQNSLTAKYITLTNWTGIDHPSAPNYVGMVSGQDNGRAGAGDCSPSIGSSCNWSGDNLGNQLFAAGIKAQWFAEDLHGDGCSISNSESGNNDVNHEPWAYMDMWQATPGACAQAGLTTKSPADAEVINALKGSNPPSFVWVTPNLTDDTHNGTVAQGDSYLQNLVTAVQATQWYAQNGTIIITYDEDEGETDPPGYCTNAVILSAVGDTCIPTFVVSAKDANVGAVSTPGDHYGMLRSLEECYGLPLLNNAAAVNSSGQAKYGDIKGRLC
jgi:acid phosphatase